MSSIEVRPFRRADREQLTALVNAHAAAVVPGVSVAVNTVMNHLEREPAEFIVDPWVAERVTLVAEQRRRIVAAAHLQRFAASEAVGDAYKNAGVIRWFLFWPQAPYWPDSKDAADVLIAGCIGVLDRWGVERQHADGTLPAPGVYGVPEQWPHVRAIYARAGFSPDGRVEVVYIADVDDLRAPAEVPVEGLEVRRSVGINGTRLSAVLGDQVVGYIEVERLDDPARLARSGGLADIGNLQVTEQYRRRGIATWLVGQAADWLQLARIDRVLDYARPAEQECDAFLRKIGFRELTRTQRGWARMPARAYHEPNQSGRPS
jgi:GNAT superfamily N-acetyltransferase